MSSSRNFRSVPPPSNLNSRTRYSRFDDVQARLLQQAQQQQLSSTIASSTSTLGFGYGGRRFQSEDDYFDQDDDEQPLPPPTLDSSSPSNSPPRKTSTKDSGDDNDDDEDEIDPLDAFMADLAKNEASSSTKSKAAASSSSISSSSLSASTLKMSAKEHNITGSSSITSSSASIKGVRQDIEDEDDEESYYRYMEANPHAGVGSLATGSDDESAAIEYDQDGNPLPPSRKMIDPLPVVYHSEIDYPSFEKNFYTEHEEIHKLTAGEVVELRRKLGIRVSGPSPPKPVTSFAHFGFDEQLLRVIRKLEYSQPTPIQAQAVPVALSGRDLIGIAKTGSGKTAAFIWPLIGHIMDQPALKPGDGPIGVILAPTRELSQQIYTEAKRFTKSYNISVVCAYGGGSKFEQSKDLEAGAEIVVATPGRMIDFVKMKATNFLRCTYLVLDEADRMFDMGFEPQVRSICNHIRPDRQTLMFSATFKKRIEKLARDVLTDPIRIVQGDNIGDANADITQVVHCFKTGTSQKWDWLVNHLVEFTSTGTVLIFVTKKQNSQELATNLEQKTNFKPLLLHGDMNQLDRNKVIQSFKRQESKILIATDVAARGLDISHIKTVINFDVALDIDTHTHRIGRTGRAGEHGMAITLVTEKDKEFAGHLVRNLEGANQEVPQELLQLAMQTQWFRKSRFKGGIGKRTGFGGGGTGGPGGSGTFRSRPGLGAAVSSSTSFIPSSASSSASTLHPGSSSSSAASSSTTSTTQLDRLAIMRQTFGAQFRSQFKPATDTAWEKNAQSSQISSSTSSSGSGGNDRKDHDQGGGGSRKKSRWG